MYSVHTALDIHVLSVQLDNKFKGPLTNNIFFENFYPVFYKFCEFSSLSVLCVQYYSLQYNDHISCSMYSTDLLSIDLILHFNLQSHPNG